MDGTSTRSVDSVNKSMRDTFVRLDNDIMSNGLRALNESSSHVEALSMIAPARAGSCALVAMHNPANNILHVACVGDSRAVLGRRISNFYDESSDSESIWKAEPLSEDQTGFNVKERGRILAEHPGESEIVSEKSGRVLGIAVSRAFGDHRWKWPLSAVERCRDHFWGTSPRPDYNTSPYLTAEPELSSTSPQNGDFLIMASDGLWDHISSEDAVRCVSMWANKPNSSHMGQGNQTTRALATPAQLPNTQDVTIDQIEKEWRSTPQDFIVEDDNAATHLARNALGGSRRKLFCSVMSMQAPESRDVRDDITIQVIFFGRDWKATSSQDN